MHTFLKKFHTVTASSNQNQDYKRLYIYISIYIYIYIYISLLLKQCSLSYDGWLISVFMLSSYVAM